MTARGGKEARLSSSVMTTQLNRGVQQRETRLPVTTMVALGRQVASVSMI